MAGNPDPFDMDERVRKYLEAKTMKADPDDPQYRYGKGAIETAGLQGIAGGMAQLGTVHGKTPSVQPYIDSSSKALTGIQALSKEPLVDPQVMEYLLAKVKHAPGQGNKTTVFQKGPPTPTGFATTFNPTTGTYEETTQQVKIPPPPKASEPKPTPAPKSMNEGEMARYDNIRMGLTALADAEAALNAGEWTFSLIGDNKYTEAAKRFEEALGRMQSGGAIQAEEATRFRSMLPTSADKEKIQKYKLKKLKDEFSARYDTLKASGKSVPDLNTGKPTNKQTVKSHKDLP